jgi:hypothetical protein
MTSIEWLIDQLIPKDQREGITDIIEEALEMHKQEIIDAYNNGDLRSADLYYQETFKQK